MRIVPVIDIKDGLAVRAVAGRREDYRPIRSRLTPSCQPAEVARAFRDQLGLQELYLADLDAISGAPPNLAVYAEIQELGLALWVDAGIGDPVSASTLTRHGIQNIVVGLETIRGPDFLKDIVESVGRKRTIFSLDLKNGLPLGKTSAWTRPEAWSIAAQAIRLGVGRIIVLDLARVGTGNGLGTEDLCRRVADEFPKVKIIAGGGVRDEKDLRRLQECGVSAVLVASALHDGSLRPGAKPASDHTDRHS